MTGAGRARSWFAPIPMSDRSRSAPGRWRQRPRGSPSANASATGLAPPRGSVWVTVSVAGSTRSTVEPMRARRPDRAVPRDEAPGLAVERHAIGDGTAGGIDPAERVAPGVGDPHDAAFDRESVGAARQRDRPAPQTGAGTMKSGDDRGGRRACSRPRRFGANPAPPRRRRWLLQGVPQPPLRARPPACPAELVACGPAATDPAVRDPGPGAGLGRVGGSWFRALVAPG